MTILALDLGTYTGVCRGDAGASPVCETWRLPAGGGRDVGPFMDAFEKMLADALPGVTVLIFEAPFVGAKMLNNMNVARRLVGLPALCEMLAHRHSIECAEANIMTLKKEFAGSGRAEKSDMIHAAGKRGFRVENEHEADASAVWLHAVALRWPEHASKYDPIFARRV